MNISDLRGGPSWSFGIASEWPLSEDQGPIKSHLMTTNKLILKVLHFVVVAYGLKSILTSFLSKEEVTDLCGRLSLPVSQRKTDLVEVICHYGSSVSGIEKVLFDNLVKRFLDLSWDEYYLEIIKLNLHFPESKSKAEILDEIVGAPMV
jgi:hypothetical protein